MCAVASGGRVGEHLEWLEAYFGPFTVDQTTVGVASTVYEHVRERAQRGLVDAVVRVWHECGSVLQVRNDEEWTLPRRRDLGVRSISAAIESAVSTEFGVDCTVDGVERVTIAGVHDRDDGEVDPVYRLFAVVDASHAGGEPRNGAWKSIDPHTTQRPTV